MSYFRKTVFWLGAIYLVPFVFGEANHYRRYGHLAPLGLHADVVVRSGDIGVKGVSKLYAAKLTNYGFLPREVPVCEFKTDTSYQGTVLAYAVELWDNHQQSWDPIWEDQIGYFCVEKLHGDEPHTFGNRQARLFAKLLWTGQSVSTDEEATAARSGLQRGDVVRFEIFTDDAGDLRKTYSTAPFRIEEVPEFGSGNPHILPIRPHH